MRSPSMPTSARNAGPPVPSTTVPPVITTSCAIATPLSVVSSRPMEFGIFLQGFVPGPDAHDPQREHDAFMREIEIAKAADRFGWKYIWATEHHGLPEYSHVSSNEVLLGYLAAVTERIHVGSGIFN